MSQERQPKGPWIARFAIRFFTFLLSVLLYWLLGFLLDDIQTTDGPDYVLFEDKHIDPDLKNRFEDLKSEIDLVTGEIKKKEETRQIAAGTSSDLQQTVNQLLELRRVSVEKGISLDEQGARDMSESLGMFMESQAKIQSLNQEVAVLVSRRQSLQDQRANLEESLRQQRKPATEEYQKALESHQWRQGLWQLGFLVPVGLMASVLVLKRRRSPYFPFFLALCVAALIKVGIVMHHYFPARFFKYVFIGVLIVCVGKLLAYFIGAVRSPQGERLIKQYREAYERFLCPICEFPIRRGPRKHLFWTRRSVVKMQVGQAEQAEEAPYTCPSCGTGLFTLCRHCSKVRYALLPHCDHCGLDSPSAK